MRSRRPNDKQATRRLLIVVGAFLAPSIANAASAPSITQVTITAPVLSVYEDGFRLADHRAQPVRVDAWTLCGDRTEDYIRRGDPITVEGEREWRFVYATSITRPDGTPACPADAAPRY